MANESCSSVHVVYASLKRNVGQVSLVLSRLCIAKVSIHDMNTDRRSSSGSASVWCHQKGGG